MTTPIKTNPRRRTSTTGKLNKTKADLMLAIDDKLREMGLHNGTDAFDPVMMMAIIGAEAYDEGDRMLSLAAFREMAHYVRPKLQATKLIVEDDTPDADVLGAKERFLLMAKGHDHAGLDQVVEDAVLLGPEKDEPYLLQGEVIDNGDA